MAGSLLSLISVLAAPAAAHMALWHPSGFGFGGDNWDSHDIANPLFTDPTDRWWFHGHINDKPEPGVFMEVPAGGKMHAEISCNRHFTSWGNHMEAGYRNVIHACDNHAMIHTGSDDFQSTSLKDVRGCGIAIAYNGNEHTVKPNDFVVISTNYQCPFYKAVDFEMPVGLPPCPPEGCICSFNWIHGPGGGRPEMCMNMFRCKVTGQMGTKPLAEPTVANKCPFDRNNCTVGAKTPFIWQTATDDNIHQEERDPPFYNWMYGFADGAQNDIWVRDESPINPENVMEAVHMGVGRDPAETPATKSGVPPAVRTPAAVTPPPFSITPGSPTSSFTDAPVETKAPPVNMAEVQPEPTTTTTTRTNLASSSASKATAIPVSSAGAASSPASPPAENTPSASPSMPLLNMMEGQGTAQPSSAANPASSAASSKSESANAELPTTAPAPSSSTGGVAVGTPITGAPPSASSTASGASSAASEPSSAASGASSGTFAPSSTSGTPSGVAPVNSTKNDGTATIPTKVPPKKCKNKKRSSKRRARF